MNPRRDGFSLIEVLLALTILSGTLLGFSYVAQKFTRSNGDVLTRTLGSEVATARVEQIKGSRSYATLVSTFNGVTETWSDPNPWSGFSRRTVVTRTGPNANNDFVTVTVVVSGRALNPAIRRTTTIAAF